MHTNTAPALHPVSLALAIAPAMKDIERRREPRVPLSSLIGLRSRDNFFAGRTRDISFGGLFIETKAALDIGTEVGVRFQVLDRVFAVTTEVTWLLRDRAGRPLGLGVRFVHMPISMVQTIAMFMRLRAPIGFEVEVSR
jgi:uncharacterized protein (TIGR02266 family)